MYLLIPLIGIGCIRHAEVNDEVEGFDYQEIGVSEAQGFEINYSDNYITLITKSIDGNTFFRDSLVIITNPTFKFDKEVKTFSGNTESVVVQSSTHLSFIQALNTLETVAGVCGLKYVVNQEANEVFVNSQPKEICNADQMAKEVLIGLNPDIIFSYPFGTSGVETYEEVGLRSLMIAEYLETDVISRLEWIKLFGILYKKENEANSYFESVKSEYENLKLDSTIGFNFIMNLPFEDNWYMPAPNSLIVNLFKDAGLNYYYEDRAGTENILVSQEQVWLDGSKSDVWIIIAQREGDFTKQDLMNENPAYGEFKSFKTDQIYFCNTLKKDYFGQGILEPQVLLKDILFLNGTLKDHSPVYFERLK